MNLRHVISTFVLTIILIGAVLMFFLLGGILGGALEVNAASPPKCFGRTANLWGTGGTPGGAGFVIVGTKANDVIVGSRGNDYLDGAGGRDRICGRRGSDIHYGGRGRDRIKGNRGPDFASGGRKSDLCRAERKRKCER